MKLFKILLVIGALVSLANCATSKAQTSSNWKLLGEKKANYVQDIDVMTVDVKPTYTKIKVRVYNGTVLMQDMKVEFGNGETIDVPLRDEFNEGGYSREIALPGTRHINKIYFQYKTADNSSMKGIVQVWGI